MINYLNFNIDLKKDMYDCFSSNVGDFYKQLSYEEFCNNLFNHYEFDENVTEGQNVTAFNATTANGIY